MYLQYMHATVLLVFCYMMHVITVITVLNSKRVSVKINQLNSTYFK